MRILLDTNVLIDVYARRQPFEKDAVRFIVMSVLGDAELWATSNSFTDDFFVLQKTFSSGEIQGMIERSFEWINVCSVDSDDVKRALSCRWPDFEDCIVDVCAKKIKADYVLTRDRSGFAFSKEVVLDPKGFFGMLERDLGLTYGSVDW